MTFKQLIKGIKEEWNELDDKIKIENIKRNYENIYYG